MFEQRKSPRYSGLPKVLVAVETDAQRYIGTLHNVSACGMSIRTQRYLSVGSSRASGGDKVCGEIMVHDELRKITGSLIRVDPDCVSMQFSSRLSDAELSRLTPGSAGTVIWKDDAAHIEGALNIDLRHDVLNSASQKIRINLSRVSRIDSSGIGLVLIALERGSKIEQCSSEIRPVMQMTRICSLCNNDACLTKNP